MKKRIITISRQFGGRGHSMGEAVAEQTGIPSLRPINPAYMAPVYITIPWFK